MIVRIVLISACQDPASLTLSFPTSTDEPTIYSGLIRQSSYHRMANDINRQLLSSSNITPGHIQLFEQMINEWHSNNPSFCTRLVRVDSVKEWHLTAQRRQLLCDQSLRLLIHRPFLLRWLKTKSMDKDSALPAEEYSAEAQCRVKGVTIARNTIGQISEWMIKGQTSRLHLSFTLYVSFSDYCLLAYRVQLTRREQICSFPCSPSSSHPYQREPLFT